LPLELLERKARVFHARRFPLAVLWARVSDARKPAERRTLTFCCTLCSFSTSSTSVV
jgi:hypothetical protein